MKKRMRIAAAILAAATALAGTLAPAGEAWAKEGAASGEAGMMAEEEMEKAAAAADGVDMPDLPEEDGEYVVYMDGEAADGVSLDGQTLEIAPEAPESVMEADLTEEDRRTLETADGEIIVEENFFLEGASSPDSEVFEEAMTGEEDGEPEWNVQMIRADEARQETDGEPVKVAVLDSGVEFLAGFPVEKSVNLVKEEQDLPYYMNDMTGHGTAVADIIHSVCPQAKIYSVRVMDKENRGRLADVVAGIYWCIDEGVDVINMSFGTDRESDILKKAVEAAAEAGILLVGSAGNGGTGSAVEYPAAFPEVMAVGAVDTGAEKTEESATGEEVELVAPGEQIATKSMLGFETVNSGTSMAAPHVAGAAALLLMQSGSGDAACIRKVLDRSGNPLGDGEEYGNGLLDVACAQKLLQEREEEILAEPESGGEAPEEPEREPAPVETFEDVDYVEGRWDTGDHEKLANVYGTNNGFTATGIKIFKAGAAYPDTYLRDNGKPHKAWHGSTFGDNRSNYISNYLYAMQAASRGGNTKGLGKWPGQDDEVYKAMHGRITTTGFYGRKYTTIMSENAGLSSYTGQLSWRQIFLYGVTLHMATDVFAHSSYYKSGGTYERILHNTAGCQADNKVHIPNRWSCAKVTAQRIAAKCLNKQVGSVYDYSSYGKSCWSGFYLRRIYEYAAEAAPGEPAANLQAYFKSMSCLDK